MKNNFERYLEEKGVDCEKTTLVTHLIGRKADAIITEKLTSLNDIDILELGCGSGRFTRLCYRQNRVTIIDINPHLFHPLPGVKVVTGNVASIKSLLPASARYDLIFSAWLTEYLCPADLRAALRGSREHLKKDGVIIFTFVNRDLLGSLYIGGARLKGIKKYSYSVPRVRKIAAEIGFRIIEIKRMRRLGFGYLATFKINPSSKFLPIGKSNG